MQRLLIIALAALLGAETAVAAERYITDEFEVTMRSGTSTSNSIVRMLRSGEAVTVLEEDLASKYSLVETGDGKKGYVVTRFLIDRPAASQTLLELQQSFAEQHSSMQQQQSEIDRLQGALDQEKTDNEALKNTLRASEQELAQIRDAAANTLSIQEQNEHLKNVVQHLQQQQGQLTEENAELRDSTRLDWFVRGGAVSLIAFVVGVLVTRIRWRRQDSWGSY